MQCFSALSGCGRADGFTLTPSPPQMLPQIWRGWLKSYLMQVCKPCHYTLIEDVEPFKLHPMSMAYIYAVFECLLRLWMGIWLHIHIITTKLVRYSYLDWGVYVLLLFVLPGSLCFLYLLSSFLTHFILNIQSTLSQNDITHCCYCWANCKPAWRWRCPVLPFALVIWCQNHARCCPTC